MTVGLEAGGSRTNHRFWFELFLLQQALVERAVFCRKAGDLFGSAEEKPVSVGGLKR